MRGTELVHLLDADVENAERKLELQKKGEIFAQVRLDQFTGEGATADIEQIVGGKIGLGIVHF